MKITVALLALLVPLVAPGSGRSEGFRLAYNSGVRGEIEPCG